jgi:primary-amine oxidase
MTILETPQATPRTLARHPLDRLTGAEIDHARQVLEAAGSVTASTRFVYVGLEEPHKRRVLDFRAGDPVERRIRMFLMDATSGLGRDVTVCLATGTVVRDVELDAASAGQMPVLDAEFDMVEDIVLADPRWVAAMAKRGLDAAKVRTVPLSAGVFGDDEEVGVRLVRVLGFHQADEHDLPWAHPVDGVVAYVDLTRQVVTKVIDDKLLPVPAERGEWDAAPHAVPQSTSLKPIEITQSMGPSFTVVDDVVTWENWTFRVRRARGADAAPDLVPRR